MKKNDPKTKIAHLKEELKQVKKENKALVKKVETANAKKSKLQKELKKKDVLKIELSKEQQQSLSNQLKGINIMSLLLD